MELNPAYRSQEMVRFIRAEGDIFVAPPEEDDVTHRELENEHNLTNRISNLRANAPEQVDAGFLSTMEDIGVVLVSGRSPKLGLPVLNYAEHARANTVAKLSELYGNTWEINTV